MKRKLLCVLAVALAGYMLSPLACLQGKDGEHSIVSELMPSVITNPEYIKTTSDQLLAVQKMLINKSNHLTIPVINKVLSVLRCADNYHLEDKQILTIIDFSLPSNQKRLWVFDLTAQKLLFYTYVSHGIRSGVLSSNYFSNKYNSKASSIGVYKTDKPYYGRHGLSLKLDGLDYGFNDNADNRAIVMHGGWYVDEQFIKKYGRAGRSWGCPAVPSELTQSIIDTIKEKSIFIAYYPNDKWFTKSKFLRYDYQPASFFETGVSQNIEEIEQRDDILFADMKSNNRLTDNAPIMVISAENYQHIFHNKAPLTRMLRRQIQDMEYVALNSNELQKIIANHDASENSIHFVVPEIKMVRGYYATEMKVVNLGKIKSIQMEPTSKFTINFEARSAIDVRSSNQFIRWIGL
ncbi:MAG: murein L,D-transpeptidase catalytic domain family protein [Legionellaceae bacterium]|nr:murein L,D-transpeptidase catalytic domain family protein [Legionellaceae bacterium]